MGCSFVSVVSLVVLILASFLANMKANTQQFTSETITKLDNPTEDSTQLQTSTPVKKPTTDQNVTMERSHSAENCSFYSEDELLNIDSTTNSSHLQNCTFLITTSVYGTKSTQGNVILKMTYRDFPEYNHYKNLLASLVYITTIPGFITNTLTIFIAMNIKPMHTCELYMIVLGFADLLTVTGKFVIRMVETFSKARYSWECKLLSFNFTVFQVYSNLILMSWTIERFIAVMFPIKLGVWCSIRNTKVTLSFLFLFCLAFSVPFITENSEVTFWNGETFTSYCQLTEFIYLVWGHVESVYYIYIPVIVVVICNVLILFKLNSMTKARISMASNKETIDKKAKENKRITILLLSISAAFVLLHIPYIVGIIFGYLYPDITVFLLEDPEAFAKVLLYTNIAFTVPEYQNCVNFFLYFLSGSKFRTKFRKLFCKCTGDRQTETMQSSRTDTTKI